MSMRKMVASFLKLFSVAKEAGVSAEGLAKAFQILETDGKQNAAVQQENRKIREANRGKVVAFFGDKPLDAPDLQASRADIAAQIGVNPGDPDYRSVIKMIGDRQRVLDMARRLLTAKKDAAE